MPPGLIVGEVLAQLVQRHRAQSHDEQQAGQGGQSQEPQFLLDAHGVSGKLETA